MSHRCGSGSLSKLIYLHLRFLSSFRFSRTSAFILSAAGILTASFQYSVRLSHLTTQIKDLSQELAILDNEIKQLRSEEEPRIRQETRQLVKQNEHMSQKILSLERQLQEYQSLITDDA